MNEKPILFSAPMVIAILEGKKTQTRRVINPQPDNRPTGHMRFYPNDMAKKRKHYGSEEHMKRGLPVDFSPYGHPGDQLWVRETWALSGNWDDVKISDLPKFGIKDNLVYRASEKHPNAEYYKWKPSIFMPRWASRITLVVSRIRVERVQEITRDDAKAEGVSGVWRNPPEKEEHYRRVLLNPYVANYSVLWDAINAGRGFGWDVNPWVWVVEFKVLEVQ